jgi:hypothetical protein
VHLEAAQDLYTKYWGELHNSIRGSNMPIKLSHMKNELGDGFF